MAVGDIWEWTVEIRETTSGERGLVTGHHKLTIENDTDLSDTGNNLATQVTVLATEVVDAISGPNVGTVCGTSHRVSPTGSRIFTNYLQTGYGIQTDPAIPAQTAVLCAKYSDTLTQQGRGRVFWPFLSASFTSSGVILASYTNTITPQLEKLYLDDLTAGQNTFEPQVWSRVGSQAHKITDLDLRPVLHSQRRRVNLHQPFVP